MASYAVKKRTDGKKKRRTAYNKYFVQESFNSTP